MSVQTLHDTGTSYTVLSKYDGGTYSMLDDCICKGIGDEFTIHYSDTSLSIYFEAGSQALIGGSFFKVTGTEGLLNGAELDPNTTTYICANIDLTRTNGNTGAFVKRTASNMKSENLNGSGSSRDLLLYIVTTSSTGVTAVEDKRVIRGGGASISGLGLVALTESEYEELPTKDNNTLYFVVEDGGN